MQTSFVALITFLIAAPVLADGEIYADVRARHDPGKIGNAIVIGRLGKPLGTQLKISGQVSRAHHQQ